MFSLIHLCTSNDETNARQSSDIQSGCVEEIEVPICCDVLVCDNDPASIMSAGHHTRTLLYVSIMQKDCNVCKALCLLSVLRMLSNLPHKIPVNDEVSHMFQDGFHQVDHVEVFAGCLFRLRECEFNVREPTSVVYLFQVHSSYFFAIGNCINHVLTQYLCHV